MTEGDDRRREAAQHLQHAAIEFIEAARALLDVAEEAVREPGALANLVAETLGGFVRASRTVRPDNDGAVEHIQIS